MVPTKKNGLPGDILSRQAGRHPNDIEDSMPGKSPNTGPRKGSYLPILSIVSLAVFPVLLTSPLAPCFDLVHHATGFSFRGILSFNPCFLPRIRYAPLDEVQ